MHTSIVGMQPAQFVTISSMSQAGNKGGVYGINQLSSDFDTKGQCNMTFSRIQARKLTLKVTFKTVSNQFCTDMTRKCNIIIII